MSFRHVIDTKDKIKSLPHLIEIKLIEARH